MGLKEFEKAIQDPAAWSAAIASNLPANLPVNLPTETSAVSETAAAPSTPATSTPTSTATPASHTNGSTTAAPKPQQVVRKQVTWKLDDNSPRNKAAAPSG